LYPLHLVREIHISGGSWDDSIVEPGRTIRRDTHDDAVPATVFMLLERTMGLCPNLRYVVLEQLGNGLETTGSKKIFYNDFLQMQSIVQSCDRSQMMRETNAFLPPSFTLANIVEDELLYHQQRELSVILESATSYDNAIRQLHQSSLAQSDWQIEQWEPHMIETALKIAQKWRHGW